MTTTQQRTANARRYQQPTPGNDSFVAVLIAIVGGVVVLFWLTTGLAGLFGSGHWVRIGISHLVSVVIGLAAHLGDPAKAYPAPYDHQVATGALWWVAFGLACVAVATVFGLVGHVVAKLRTGRHQGPLNAAAWASRADLAPIRVPGASRGRAVLGRHVTGLVAVEAQHSVMVIGPAGSMKTTGVVIPAVLEWDGPVIVVSIKADVLDATYAARSRRGGTTWVFDPTLVSPAYERAGWSPLRSCKDWEEAQRIASAMASAAQTASGQDLRDDSFWYGGAASVLALYLFVAASWDLGIGDVVHWVSVQEEEAIKDRLVLVDNSDALDAWEALWSSRDQLRKDYFATAVSALRAFSTPAVRECLASDDIDFATFLNGASNTIYVSAPMADQNRLRPLFSAFLTEALDTIYHHAARDGAPDPPVLVVIDEAANVAPLAQLPSIASTARSHGVQLVTIWQDMAQVEERYRSSSRTLFNNHRAKLLLSGCSDLTTLQYWANLLGEAEVRERSTHRDVAGLTSSTDAPRRHALAPVEWIRQMRPGEALLVYGSIRPAQLVLRVSWSDPELRAIATEACEHPATNGPDGTRPVGAGSVDQRSAASGWIVMMSSKVVHQLGRARD